MGKHRLYPLLALLLGAAGAGARLWQLSCYENGFPPSGGLPALALPLLSVGSALLFLMLALKAKGCQAGALYEGTSRPRAALLLASGGLLLLSAIFHLLTVTEVLSPVAGSPFLLRFILTTVPLEVLLVLLSVPTVVSIVFLAKDRMEGSGRSAGSLTVIFPVLYAWVWLIDVYRRNTSDPILWNYAFLLLAVIALLLSAFGRAGFSFGDGRACFTLFVSLLALYLTPVALTTPMDWASRLTVAAFLLYALVTAEGLLRNEPMPAPASQAEIETEVSSDE